MSEETTTIEITEEQRDYLRDETHGRSAKESLQELIDNHNEPIDTELLSDAQRGEVRKIVLDVVNQRVRGGSLE